MLDWLARREVVIALAVAGGVLSVLSTLVTARRAGPPPLGRWLNGAAYGFMAASIVLFIIAGLR